MTKQESARRNKNRLYYRREVKDYYMKYKEMTKLGHKKNADIYLNRAYHDYENYLYYGGRLMIFQILKGKTDGR